MTMGLSSSCYFSNSILKRSNMSYEEMVSRVAASTGLSKKLVDRAYKSYWRVVREHITSLPLKSDLTDEEFLKLKVNVNIPSLGKLYVSLNKYKYLKEKDRIINS